MDLQIDRPAKHLLLQPQNDFCSSVTLPQNCFPRIMAPKHEYIESQDSDEESTQGLLEESQIPGRDGTYKDCLSHTWTFVLVQIVLLFFYTMAFISLAHQDRDLVYCKMFKYFSHCGLQADIYIAPAQTAVKYERVSFNATLVIDSPYNGEPSAKVDQAWTELLQCKKLTQGGIPMLIDQI